MPTTPTPLTTNAQYPSQGGNVTNHIPTLEEEASRSLVDFLLNRPPREQDDDPADPNLLLCLEPGAHPIESDPLCCLVAALTARMWLSLRDAGLTPIATAHLFSDWPDFFDLSPWTEPVGCDTFDATYGYAVMFAGPYETDLIGQHGNQLWWGAGPSSSVVDVLCRGPLPLAAYEALAADMALGGIHIRLVSLDEMGKHAVWSNEGWELYFQPPCA